MRLVQQDRAMEAQRARERLEYAAGKAALAIQGRMAAIEDQLVQGHGLRFTPRGVEGILYQGSVDRSTAGHDFRDAEALEFQRKDPVAAAAEYRRLSASADPATRAGALVRLGRVLRNTGDAAGALRAYESLQALGSLTVDGEPAEMIARVARCRIYESSGDHERLQAESGEMARTLRSGTVRMDRATFSLYRDMLREWGAAGPSPDALATTEAALDLWQEWRSGVLPARGRRLVRGSILAVWSGSAAAVSTLAQADAELGEAWRNQGLTAAMYDAEGQHLWGKTEGAFASLTPGDTRLPFMVRLAFRQPPGGLPEAERRKWLLAAGLLFTMVLTLAAAYGLFRATSKEMALARRQSDFVSAVSHEFRTPLTSMRHLTELLAAGSVPTDERKSQYYGLLLRETERLQRMVESLLNFGRMNAGAHAWRLAAADPGELVRGIVQDFRDHTPGHDLVCEVEQGLPQIQADREALSRAVSNLLENAQKYSEPGTAIRVAARRDGATVRISVEDRGMGIPRDEQSKLFEQFARGAHAVRSGIRGIGIGLALVKSVAEAHGGAVLLESEPGRGSTFTLVIPCQES
jgi:signal transduction histidine kinase